MSGVTAASLATKALRSLSLDEIIYLHLENDHGTSTNDFRVISCLNTIEENMRATNQNDRMKTYAPVLCAYAVLDQLGSCYSDLSNPMPSGHYSSVVKALHNFGGIPAGSPESEYLYAFRNGMVHDASMTSHSTKKDKWYVFRYDDNLSSVITLPKNDWDGSAQSIGPNTQAWINRNALIDMTSMAVRSVKELYRNNRKQLGVLLQGEEIIHKYLLWG